MNFLYSGSCTGGSNPGYQPYSPPPGQQHQLPSQYQPQMYQPHMYQPSSPQSPSMQQQQQYSPYIYDSAPAPAPAPAQEGSSGEQVQSVTVHRPSPNASWGFRLQGGADYRTQLSVKRTEPGSAAYGILSSGDAILSINGKNTRDMTHTEATNLIKRCSGSLGLSLINLKDGREIFMWSLQAGTHRGSW